MIIEYDEFYFEICTPSETHDAHNVPIALKLIENNLKLWECNLRGLWKDEFERETPILKRIWEMHEEGDYFQQTLKRHNYELHPHTSYTAIFHLMVQNNSLKLDFINNIYSTSKLNWLNMGYLIAPEATNVWAKQVKAKFAIYCEDEQRYKLIL